MAIEHADYINVGVCEDPTCKNVHIMLCDVFNEPFAQFTLDAGHVDKLIDDIRDMHKMVKQKGN